MNGSIGHIIDLELGFHRNFGGVEPYRLRGWHHHINHAFLNKFRHWVQVARLSLKVHIFEEFGVVVVGVAHMAVLLAFLLEELVTTGDQTGVGFFSGVDSYMVI